MSCIKMVRMKKLFILLPLLFLSTPVVAQQTNIYQVCRAYRESYDPGYYDQYGNYFPGRLSTQSYNVPCNQVTNSWNPPNRYNNRRVIQNQCDPTKAILGAILGGGVAASMSRGDGYKWSVPLGAFIGGTAFSC